MPPTLTILALAGAASTVWLRYAPRYSPGIIAGSILLAPLFGVVYFLWAVVVYPRVFSPLRHLPTPPDRDFFLGQTKRIFREKTGAPALDWVENIPNNGLIRYSMLFQDRVLLTTPAALSEVLVTKNYEFIKPARFLAGLGQIVGRGVLLAEGDEHRWQRKHLSPAFAFRHIKDIYPVFWSKSREMVRAIIADQAKKAAAAKEGAGVVEVEAEGAVKHQPDSVNVGSWSSRATLDIIGVSGMGHDFNSVQDPSNKLYQTYQTIFAVGRGDRFLRLLGLIVPFAILQRIPTERNRQMKDAVAAVRETCRELIAAKRARIDKAGRAEVDILSVALESGTFTDENLVDQMMTFLVAGHETTATAMLWAVYTLCKHPEVQTKLRNEIRGKIPSLDHDITAADIDDCHYLQAFCNEVLRVWGPVPMTLRIAANDTTICGEFIPKGTTVIITPSAINLSEKLWGPDASEFKPERWLDKDGKANQRGSSSSNYSFLTFLHGPRSCIGEKFARAEFACLVAAWVGAFDAKFEEGSPLISGPVDVQSAVTAKPRGGIYCHVDEVPGW